MNKAAIFICMLLLLFSLLTYIGWLDGFFIQKKNVIFSLLCLNTNDCSSLTLDIHTKKYHQKLRYISSDDFSCDAKCEMRFIQIWQKKRHHETFHTFSTMFEFIENIRPCSFRHKWSFFQNAMLCSFYRKKIERYLWACIRSIRQNTN